jgi:DDE superfamily endonuclease
VLGKTAARHTSAGFVAFFTDIVIDQPRGKEIHVVADNLSAHKSRAVTDFLAVYPKVHLHFTPTYSSWLKRDGHGRRADRDYQGAISAFTRFSLANCREPWTTCAETWPRLT